ncbi:MAG: hypothetical protein HFH96_07820 [Lachnospiraceae bacterium]|jgi:stage V sporulation protein AB|nr:stage V sporulation protein AB [uncultured Acetatifactor sp.]MCI9231000.1 hypothetical protein [Lachnospiraceae bacterium]
MMRNFFLILIGGSYGLLAAAGVFTVLAAVGLVPRFAGKTHTAEYVTIYEEMVIFGTLTGCVLSVFSRYCRFHAWWQQRCPQYVNLLDGAGTAFQAVFGLFAGMFVGCLALAIAEMLDSIPILTRRISFRHGLGLAIISMAAGKICGSLLYFLTELHRTV